ncbi:MAG: SDR family NAD(P)-dependent oxidoreductase [Pseudomonadota bacterium]
MGQGKLEGQVAVVTGGASGIGKACALRFAAEGAEIVLADLRGERLEAAAEELRRTTNGRVLAMPVNVTEEEDVEAMAQRALTDCGRLDVLLAAAGISHAGYVSGSSAGERGDTVGATNGGLLDVPLANWNRVLAVNLTGVMLSNRAAARCMIAAGNGGRIVNIASSAARIPLVGAGDYSVSKAGVAMLTQVLAQELVEHGIRVNGIGPGFIGTPMTQGMQDDEEGRANMLAMTPMGRLGTVDEMAATALFLASDDSSYTTGQTLYPNGGMFVG